MSSHHSVPTDFQSSSSLQSLWQSVRTFSTQHKFNTAGLLSSTLYAFLCPYVGIPLAATFLSYRIANRLLPSDEPANSARYGSMVRGVVAAVGLSAFMISFDFYWKKEAPSFTGEQIEMVRKAARDELKNCAQNGICGSITNKEITGQNVSYALTGHNSFDIFTAPIDVRKELDGQTKACANVSALRTEMGSAFTLPVKTPVTNSKRLGYFCITQ